MYLACEGLFVLGSLLALTSSGITEFTAGRVFQGLATGMLLVAALPPLVTGHGVAKLPGTAAVVNLGLFGMVTLGPVLGGFVTGAQQWRILFLIGVVLGLAAIGLGLLAFEHKEASNPGTRIDWQAIPLALGATFLPFFGTAWLTRSSFGSPGFLAPVTIGLALVVVLIVSQYRKKNPLMPVRPIRHTLPITGTLGAMVVGAAFTTLLELAELFLMMGTSRNSVGISVLLVTQVPGVALAAWLFKRALPTKWTPVLALSGLVSVLVAGVVLLGVSASNVDTIVPVAALLLGYGAGAGVAPGLFLAGLSVPSNKIGPTFALVELLRSEAAFLVGPAILFLAVSGGSVLNGVHMAVALMLGCAILGGALALGIYLLGGARLHPPDLQLWLEGNESAYDSPPLAARVRGL